MVIGLEMLLSANFVTFPPPGREVTICYSVHLVGNKQNNRGKAYQVLLGDVKLIKSYPIQKPRVPVSNVIIIASLLFPYYFFVLVLFWSRNLTRGCV